MAAAVVVLLFALPHIVPAHVVVSLTVVFALGLCAIGFDLTWGFCGIFSFGQAIFLGIGAYSTGVLAGSHGHVGLLENLAVAGLLGGLAALVLGAFLFVGRRVGIVFTAVATLVASYIVSEFASSWTAVGGENGITGLPYPALGSIDFRLPTNMYVLTLSVLLVGLALVALLLRSHLGTAVRALRTDELRAAHLGYPTVRIKLAVFTLGGVLSGVSGSLYAFQLGGVSPEMIGVDMSTQIVLWVLIGGTGTLVGGLVGVTVLQLLGNQLSGDAARMWPILLGVILVLFATRLQQGLVPALWQAGRNAVRLLRRWSK